MIAYTTSRMPSLQQASDAREPAAATPFLPGRPQPLHFFAAGAEIYGQNEKAGSIYQVEFGAVRVCRLLADGRRQVASFHLPGDSFGLEIGDRHRFSAEAITDCGVRTYSLASRPDMPRELLALALHSLGRTQDHLLVLSRQAACERVGAFLLELAERQGGGGMVELPMSRMDIGDHLGLTIETVSRIFSKFKQQGIIRLPSLRCVEIVRWDALQGMSA